VKDADVKWCNGYNKAYITIDTDCLTVGMIMNDDSEYEAKLRCAKTWSIRTGRIKVTTLSL
jgi:hypothetical protein